MATQSTFDESTFRLLDAFVALPHVSRQKFLSELCEHLRPSEWWLIKKILTDRDESLRCDIVGALPIEILFQIFDYLPLTASINLRLVSKQWNELLSSDTFCRFLATKWYPSECRHYMSNEGQMTKPWSWVFENALSRYTALCRGDFKYKTIETPDIATRNVCPGALSYYDGYLAGLDENQMIITIADLNKFPVTTWSFPIPTRGVIWSIHLMKDYIWANEDLDRSRAHIMNLRTNEWKRIQYPNAGVRYGHADGNFVAHLCGSYVYLYSAETNTLTTICQEGKNPSAVDPWIADAYEDGLFIIVDSFRNQIVVRSGLQDTVRFYSMAPVKLIKTERFNRFTTIGPGTGDTDMESGRYLDGLDRDPCLINTTFYKRPGIPMDKGGNGVYIATYNRHSGIIESSYCNVLGISIDDSINLVDAVQLWDDIIFFSMLNASGPAGDTDRLSPSTMIATKVHTQRIIEGKEEPQWLDSHLASVETLNQCVMQKRMSRGKYLFWNEPEKTFVIVEVRGIWEKRDDEDKDLAEHFMM
ncbi:hypothetical protein FPQ18DRAFT_358188 [Pyronema domesticum]|uniref:F-box domain-containing protein n=1 Tax=Pyronema omphalodes (strain CBS 100304) TaxID=1076935 RepID=U4LWU2_PYROM|nr:hypothetical protein FPQ18DRAFT_358188 [Pyronema domesticum]CCX34073.1 Similar to hypothetical protein [Tuber melanosporum Mel28]; acc. no. XP_002839996 [Pyronema omphalodes CBS 100304]